MLNLVTGYRGTPHITAEDEGSKNASLFGAGVLVLEGIGNELAYNIQSHNSVRVLSGDVMAQGRHIRVTGYEDCTITTGTQNLKRNDLICLRYEKEPSTGIESVALVVKTGTAATTAIDPEYATGDILEGDSLVEIPLYRVSIEGLEIVKVKPLFEKYKGGSSMRPQLIVSCDSGTIVTATKGDYSIEVTAENDTAVIEVPEFGEWTVTAGEEYTKITVDTVKQYFASTSYEQVVNYTMLYDNGDECTDITGGFVSGTNYSSNPNIYGSVEKNANDITITSSGSGGMQSIRTTNNIDLHAYSSLCLIGDIKTKMPYEGSKYMGFWLGTVDSLEYQYYPTNYADAAYEEFCNNTEDFVAVSKKLSIHEIETPSYVFTGVGAGSGNYIKLRSLLLTKEDDIRTLGDKAGLNVTSLESLLVDTNALAIIFNNANAAKFMVAQCTGDFMVGVCNNANAMAQLCNSIAYDYAFANEHWYKFMTMSPVALSAMKSVATTVPTMTGKTAPSGEIIFSSLKSDEPTDYGAFNRTNATWTSSGATNQWVGYKFENKITLFLVEITNGTSTANLMDSFKVQGSNDGESWTDILPTQNRGGAGGETTSHVIPQSQPYLMFRVYGSSSVTTAGIIVLRELQFYGKAVAE